MSDLNTQSLGKEVPVGAISRELKKLWEDDVESTKASLINLLVYTENPENLARNSESVLKLTREHSCRALLIAMDRKAPEASIRSWITAHCHLSNGKKSVCSEQIAFLLSGKAIGRLRNTVFANLNSDLPLVFWWQGELSNLFEESLYRLFDRLIINSGAWANPKAGFEKITAAQENMHGKLVVQDLAWTRSFHFRVALAALFDDPLALRVVGEITQVRIAAQKNHRLTALFLLAWLATQAGWKRGQELPLDDDTRTEDGESYYFETPHGNPVEVSLNWDENGAPLGLLEVTAPDCFVRVEREKDAKFLTQFLEAGDHKLALSGPADEDDAVALLGEQLARGGQNLLYQKVLPELLQLL